MIELETQFQLIVTSIVFGMVCTNIYTFIEIVLRKIYVFKTIIKLAFFMSASITYYYLIFIIDKGILNIYLPISLVAGYLLHMKFYDKYFSCRYEYLFSKINSIMDKKKARWKKLWRGLMKKKAKKEELTE